VTADHLTLESLATNLTALATAEGSAFASFVARKGIRRPDDLLNFVGAVPEPLRDAVIELAIDQFDIWLAFATALDESRPRREPPKTSPAPGC
jgi:hypothetical protein